jgi:hypothetical protein
MSLKLHPEKPPLHFPVSPTANLLHFHCTTIECMYTDSGCMHGMWQDADYSTDIQEAMNMTVPQYALFLKR